GGGGRGGGAGAGGRPRGGRGGGGEAGGGGRPAGGDEAGGGDGPPRRHQPHARGSTVAAVAPKIHRAPMIGGHDHHRALRQTIQERAQEAVAVGQSTQIAPAVTSVRQLVGDAKPYLPHARAAC